MKDLARRPQAAHGVFDLIRNALPFPLPFHNSRTARLPQRSALSRNNSSPSLHPSTSTGSVSSLPGSARGARTSRRRTRTLQRSQIEAMPAVPDPWSNTSVSGARVTSPVAMSGDLSMHSGHRNSPGESDASGSDSESESESDSQTFYGVARQIPKGRANGVQFQASFPAMQYCAFVIPPTHDQVCIQRAAEQRIQELRRRIKEALKDSQDRLDLAARVKQLQVHTQQVLLAPHSLLNPVALHVVQFWSASIHKLHLSCYRCLGGV